MSAGSWMTRLVGRTARLAGLLTLVCVVGLAAVRGVGALLHAPQITFGIEQQHLDPITHAFQFNSSSLMAYDVWTGQTSAILAGLSSLPVAWSWSPDGDTLTYVLLNALDSTYSVVAFTPAGRQQHVLADGLPFGAPPEWSPDGAQIALVSRTNDICLYTVAQPDSIPDCLNVTPAGQPTWSPDSADIAYLSRLQNGGIYRVNIASRVISEVLPSVPHLTSPRWSPDGAVIVFSGQSAPGESTHLWLVRPDGTGLEQITDQLGSQDQPRWSPDGTKIAYNHRPSSLTSTDIYVFDMVNRIVYPAAINPSIEADPHWSPDGNWLSFVTDRYDGRPRLQVVPAPVISQPESIPDMGVSIRLYSHDWRP